MIGCDREPEGSHKTNNEMVHCSLLSPKGNEDDEFNRKHKNALPPT